MKRLAAGLQFYDKMREDFLSGKSVRAIALETSLEPQDVLDFLKWLGREHDIERAIRTDGVLAKLMVVADELSKKMLQFSKNPPTTQAMADLKILRTELNDVLKTYHELAGLNQKWVEHKRKIPQGGRPSKARAERDVDGMEEREPTGGLEAALERTKGGPRNGKAERAERGPVRVPRRGPARPDPEAEAETDPGSDEEESDPFA